MKFTLNTLIKRPTIKELDTLWAKAVKKRAGLKCEFPGCSKTNNLNAHHLYSRSRKSVRWDVENGIALCSGHHAMNNNSAHKSPDFKDTLIAYGVRTEDFFYKMSIRANSPSKIDYNLIKLDLLNEIKKYEIF